MTMQHLVWLDDALDPITDDDLAASMQEGNDRILSGTLTRERGALPALEVEMAHPGWGIFAPGQRRGVALVLSEDGTMATAVVKARGYLRAMPSALTGDTLTLSFECSPEDWEERREAAAQAALDAASAKPGPWTDALPAADRSIRGGVTRDTLYGRSANLLDDLLQSTTAWVRHDPVTHDVTLVDDAVRARVHNLGDGYDPSSLQVTEGEGAVEQVTLTVYANVNENVSGTCDLAPNIPQLTSLCGYTASGSTDMSQNIGWSLGQPELDQVYRRGMPTDTGRIFRVEYRQVYYVQVPNAQGQMITATSYGPIRVYDYYERQRRRVQHTRFRSWPAQYRYSQTRRENVRLTLDVPCQRVGGIKRVLDMGELSLGDLYRPDLNDDDAEIAVAGDDASQGFAAGAYYFLAGQLFRARRDTTEQPYVARVNRRMQSSIRISEDWAPVPVQPAMPDMTAPSFVDLPRGKAAIAHALLRMRKAALDRLVAWSVTLTCQRADLPDVDLEDHVRFVLPARWDQDGRECVGRVTKIVETWSGADGDTVTVTLAVPVGTGLDGVAAASRVDRYGGSGYFGAGSAYLAQGTPHLSAGDDVEYVYRAAPLVQHVDGRSLSWVAYSLRDLTIRGSAAEQEADFIAAAGRELAPTPEVTKPTNVEPRLVPLITEKLIEREVTVTASLLFSPRGIDLSAGA